MDEARVVCVSQNYDYTYLIVQSWVVSSYRKKYSIIDISHANKLIK